MQMSVAEHKHQFRMCRIYQRVGLMHKFSACSTLTLINDSFE